MSSNMSSSMSAKESGSTDAKYLILLDMNGTLCYRSEVVVAGVTRDLFLRRKYYYGRHGIVPFLDALKSSDKFVICAYTSMMAHNVRAGLDA